MKKLLDYQLDLLKIYGQDITDPGDPEPEEHIIRTRMQLVAEESDEFVDSLSDLLSFRSAEGNRAHILKEFADLLTVIFGSMAQLGFTSEELEKAYEIVNIDNQSKCYLHHASAADALRHYQTDDKYAAIREVNFNGTTLYVVVSSIGKIYKRYPRPELTAEESILKYVVRKQ